LPVSAGEEEDVLQILFNHKSLTGLLFITVFSTWMLATLLAEPAYEASFLLIVGSGKEGIRISGSQPVVAGPAANETLADKMISSEMKTIRGRKLIQEVIHELGIDTIYPEIENDWGMNVNPFLRPLNSFQRAQYLMEENGIHVHREEKSDIIKVSFRHQNPFIAANVVNALMTAYLKHRGELFTRLQDLNPYDDQVLGSKDRPDMGASRRQRKLDSLDKEKIAILHELSGLEFELAGARRDIARAAGIPAVRMYGRESSEGNPAGIVFSLRPSPVIAMVARAAPPLNPVKPDLLLNTFKSLAAGALAGAGGILLLLFFKQGFYTVEDKASDSSS
jgi:hypothetical protein